MNFEERIHAFDTMLESCLRAVVVTHIHPDGDAVGSSCAMFHFLTSIRKIQTTVLLPHRPQDQLLFLCKGCNPVCDDTAHEKALTAIAASDLLICLDFNEFSRAGLLGESLRASRAKKVLIDHHLNPDEGSFDLCFSKIDVSSASELLYQILSGMKEIKGDASMLPPDCSNALMAGMTTDTNNFANSVFPSTLAMASALLAAGVDRDAILCHLYNEYRENRVRAMAYLLSKMTITESGVAYMILTKKEQDALELREGETEAFVNIPLSIGKVTLSIFAREDEGFYRISIRSKKGVSANTLARGHFHGGGHELAAGGRLLFPEDIPDRNLATDYIEKVTARFMNESGADIL